MDSLCSIQSVIHAFIKGVGGGASCLTAFRHYKHAHKNERARTQPADTRTRPRAHVRRTPLGHGVREGGFCFGGRGLGYVSNRSRRTARVHTYTHTYTHTHTHTHTRTHKQQQHYRHTYTHTHTHTDMLLRMTDIQQRLPKMIPPPRLEPGSLG